MEKQLDGIYNLLWGTPMLLLMLGVGVWLTVCTRCVQVRFFPVRFGDFCAVRMPARMVFPHFERCVPPWRPRWEQETLWG